METLNYVLTNLVTPVTIIGVVVMTVILLIEIHFENKENK